MRPYPARQRRCLPSSSQSAAAGSPTPGNGQTLQSGSSSEALVGGRLQPMLPGVTHPLSPRPGLASGSFPEAPAGCGHTQRAPLQLRCADPGLARSRGRPALASRPAASSGTRVTAEGHTAVRDPRQHVRFSGNERREVNSSVEETPEPVMPHVFLLAVQVAACGGRYPSLTAEGPRGGCRAGPRTAARWLVASR